MSEDCGSGNPPPVTHLPSRRPPHRLPVRLPTDQFQRLLKHLRNVVRRISLISSARLLTQEHKRFPRQQLFLPLSLTSDRNPLTSYSEVSILHSRSLLTYSENKNKRLYVPQMIRRQDRSETSFASLTHLYDYM